MTRQAKILLAAAMAMAACQEPEFKAPPPPPVVVALPMVRDVQDYVTLTGTTEPVQTVEVRARVEGVLLEIAHHEGRPVKQGDPMFRIDPAPFQAAVDAAKAQVEKAKAEAKLADVTASKLEAAYADRAVSELQAIEARARHAVALQNIEVAAKNLAIRDLDLSYTQVHAPISGRAEKSDYFVGSLVGGLGSSALTRIVDESKIRVWFNVPDRALLQLRKERETAGQDPRALGQMPAIEVGREVDEGFPFVGQVDYADPDIDVETGTLRVRAVVDNADGRLLGGLFVRVRFTVGTLEKAIIVPEAALGSDQRGRYLYVVGGDDVVERREVELGPRTEQGIVVSKGLAGGERVIVAGQLSARPGAKVRPQKASDTQTGEDG